MLGHHEHPVQKAYLDLYKLGPGPLYVFYRPYHLCHFEVPSTLARAVLFEDATIAPLDGPRVEVVTAAKRDLRAGEVLDGIGFYMTYGLAENADVVARENLLPMGIAEGCRLEAGRRQGPGPDLRGRRASRGQAVRPAPRRADGALRGRVAPAGL